MDAARTTIGQVPWDDLNFEREFALIPATSWRPFRRHLVDRRARLTAGAEVNADGVIIGTVQKTAQGAGERAVVQRPQSSGRLLARA